MNIMCCVPQVTIQRSVMGVYCTTADNAVRPKNAFGRSLHSDKQQICIFNSDQQSSDSSRAAFGNQFSLRNGQLQLPYTTCGQQTNSRNALTCLRHWQPQGQDMGPVWCSPRVFGTTWQRTLSKLQSLPSRQLFRQHAS